MFRRSRFDTIQPGSSFRQPGSGMLVSTAKVLTVQNDCGGIPHVHFELLLSAPSCAARREGTRVLAIDRFAAIYSVPVYPAQLAS